MFQEDSSEEESDSEEEEKPQKKGKAKKVDENQNVSGKKRKSKDEDQFQTPQAKTPKADESGEFFCLGTVYVYLTLNCWTVLRCPRPEIYQVSSL